MQEGQPRRWGDWHPVNMGVGGEKDESKMTARILARTGTCMVVSITESLSPAQKGEFQVWETMASSHLDSMTLRYPVIQQAAAMGWVFLPSRRDRWGEYSIWASGLDAVPRKYTRSDGILR